MALQAVAAGFRVLGAGAFFVAEQAHVTLPQVEIAGFFWSADGAIRLVAHDTSFGARLFRGNRSVEITGGGQWLVAALVKAGCGPGGPLARGI